MSTHKTDDLYEIGNLLGKVSKGKILTPMDVSNKVHSYVTEQPKQDEEVVQESLDQVGEDLGDARFQPGDVLSAEQLGEDSDYVVIGITEDENGEVAYDLMQLGVQGITVSDKDIQGDDARPLF